MVIEPFSNDKIKIRLSNTESVTQNIFKYTSIDKLKETKSTSSTCNYFLTTNDNLAGSLKQILNDESKVYNLDVEKMKKCLKEQEKILEDLELKSDFKGNLKPFYDSLEYFNNTDKRELTIGEGIVRKDQGGKYNIYFDNSNKNVELFRNGVIALISDVIIENQKDKYLIYPVIKEDVINNNEIDSNKRDEAISRISELAKRLESEYDEEIVKQIIIEGYKLIN